MFRIAFTLCVVLLVRVAGVHAQSPPPAEEQIAAAVQAAPPPMQETATVLGYEQNGALDTLREGDGPLVCLADNPKEEAFHVACYHERLEPFMKRGRQLRQQGVDDTAVDSIRRAEIEDGTLAYPDTPTALYNLSGPPNAYSAAADTVRDASRLRVVYVPYETAETTGLPTRPQGDQSWLMAPGEPWAHIMIPE